MSERIIKYYAVNEDADDSAVINSNDRMQAAIDRYAELAVKRIYEERSLKLEQYKRALQTDDDGNIVYPRDEAGNIVIPEDSQGNPLFSLSEDGVPILDAPAEIASGEAEEGFGEGIGDVEGEAGAEPAEEAPDPDELLAEAHAEAERLVQEAQSQADDILADAQSQADALKSRAEEEGRQAGYNAGHDEAMAELDQQRQALEDEERALQADYDEKAASMEKDLVATISDVMAKYFRIELSDRKDVLMHVIENALLNIENSRTFLIHVAQSQYEDLSAETDALRAKVGEDATVDIIMDPTLEEGKCLIETDGGIYDCSIDTELKSIVKELKELSLQ